MGVLDYIIKKMEYDVNINKKIDFNKIEQEMSIVATFLEDKKYIDINFGIVGKDSKEVNIFNLKVEYRVELEKEIEDTTNNNIENIIKKFYPKFEKFIKNFYSKEAGLHDLKPPKF